MNSDRAVPKGDFQGLAIGTPPDVILGDEAYPPHVHPWPPVTRSERVEEMHRAFGMYTPETPTIPPVDATRLRLRLVAEEFFELLQATLYAPKEIEAAETEVMALIKNEPVDIEMTDAADALEDLDVVIEGMRQTFGIDGEPIAAVVHAANLAKVGGPVRADGKQGKPEGWQAPDIMGELVKQGYRGGE